MGVTSRRTYAVISSNTDPFDHQAKTTGRYEGYVSSYVEKRPFNLFDIRRQRTISRSVLKDDISAALRRWIKIPLTCSDILDVVSNIDSSSGSWQSDEEPQYLRSFIFSAMTKDPLIDGEAGFLSTLGDELRLYSKGRSAYLDPLPIDSRCSANMSSCRIAGARMGKSYLTMIGPTSPTQRCKRSKDSKN